MFTHIAFNPVSVDIFWKLSAAMLCGVLIGTERNISHKSAGMRTYALVAMGAALFVVVGDMVIQNYLAMGLVSINPYTIPAAIISGSGFMCAGVIIFREKSVTGLTTGSGLWVAAGIGMAAGYGFFIPAFMATLMTLFIFEVLWRLEKKVKDISAYDEPEEQLLAEKPKPRTRKKIEEAEV
jgi:putative Mg2+ transporter-C (MgtC) family protein